MIIKKEMSIRMYYLRLIFVFIFVSVIMIGITHLIISLLIDYLVNNTSSSHPGLYYNESKGYILLLFNFVLCIIGSIISTYLSYFINGKKKISDRSYNKAKLSSYIIILVLGLILNVIYTVLAFETKVIWILLFVIIYAVIMYQINRFIFKKYICVK